MLLLTVIVYVIGGIILAISKVLNTRSYSRKLRIVSTAILMEIAYALVVMNVINIVTAFCIEVDEDTILDPSYAADKFFVIISMVLILLANGSQLLTLEDSF